ncbi:MAG: ATP-binding protein, partial [Saprospiraceae bacterium]
TLPGVLEQDGIVAATHALVSKLTVQYNTLFNLKEEDHIGRFQIDMEHQLYQIILESIHNIVKHADARFVNINFKKVDRLFIVSVEDDGRGIDVDLKKEGKGISKMISLANKMGGEYKIENLLPNGTKIWVKIPIEENSKN